MAVSRSQIGYRYSLGWLIFWIILFFPVALALLLTGIYYKTDVGVTFLDYGGSRGWLAFWSLIFFPIALILLIFNGLALVRLNGPEAAQMLEELKPVAKESSSESRSL